MPGGKTSPVVLHSGEARAVLIELQSGQRLGDHEVKEATWAFVVEGTASRPRSSGGTGTAGGRTGGKAGGWISRIGGRPRPCGFAACLAFPDLSALDGAALDSDGASTSFPSRRGTRPRSRGAAPSGVA